MRATLLTVLFLTACSAQHGLTPNDNSCPEPTSATPCPRTLPAPHLLPGSRPEHRQPGFWISRLDHPDAIILDEAEIRALNEQARGLGAENAGLGSRYDPLSGPVPPENVLKQMRAGLDRHRERAAEGHRVKLDGGTLTRELFAELNRIQSSFEPASDLHLTRELTDIRCHPTSEGFYEYAGDVDFDLALCSTARPGELIRVVSRHPEGWLLVRTPYSFGWVQFDQLGPEVSDAEALELRTSESFIVVTSDRAPIWRSTAREEQISVGRIGLRLPLVGSDPTGLVEVRAPSANGLVNGWMDAGDVHEGYLPFTGRVVLTHAFRQLDDVFGWAGAGGDRDCSRFLMDLFALFGIELPRNSYWQSQATSYTVETEGFTPQQRVDALEESLERGVPLVFMPGHIMLLLGRDGEDFHAIHQFSGYRVGCNTGRDVKMVVDRLAVTTMRLGEGSQRRSFMERFTRISVIGRR